MSSLADDEEEKTHLSLMERVWETICDDRTEMCKLDLDTFQVVVVVLENK
jgi:hypothetical protein